MCFSVCVRGYAHLMPELVKIHQCAIHFMKKLAQSVLNSVLEMLIQ